jgi:hypothetical protein
MTVVGLARAKYFLEREKQGLPPRR